MEVYARVRRAVHVDGMSTRQAAREFGLSRKTIRKMQQFSQPPGYERKKPVERPKLGPWLGVVDQILEDDQSQPKKQRHTAKRIWDRLKAEHGFGGGYTVVKDYVRQARLRHKEVLVPLAHPPGDAQADFGEALVVIGGVEQKAHFVCFDLPHSDDCFVMAFPAENTEAFLEGHNQAFAYFGGVPRTILYDNTRIAVKEITGNGERRPTEAFSGLQSHYLFTAKFGRPGKGNDKGNVEGLVGYARRNFMVPVPRVGACLLARGKLLHVLRQNPVPHFLKRPRIKPGDLALLVQQNEIRVLFVCHPKLLLPRTRTAINSDHVLVIRFRSAAPHPTVDEPLAHARHPADHGTLVKGYPRIRAEIVAKSLGPRFHGEPGIVAKAERQKRGSARGGPRQYRLAARKKFAFQLR